MTTSALLFAMNALILMQEENSFILTGFFLPWDSIDKLREHLTVDDPSVGAVGRFEGIPVFEESDQNVDPRGVSKIGTSNEIRYSYVTMGVVN